MGSFGLLEQFPEPHEVATFDAANSTIKNWRRSSRSGRPSLRSLEVAARRSSVCARKGITGRMAPCWDRTHSSCVSLWMAAPIAC